MWQRQNGATQYMQGVNKGYFGNLQQQQMGYETQYNEVSPYNRHQFKVDSFEQDLSMPLDTALIDSDISK
jgi:hypothetical protein